MSKQMLELADRLAGSLQPFNFLTRDERDLIIAALRSSAVSEQPLTTVLCNCPGCGQPHQWREPFSAIPQPVCNEPQVSAESALSSKHRASKILFGDPTWIDRPDMADQMDDEFVEDNGSSSRRVTPNQLIAELDAQNFGMDAAEYNREKAMAEWQNGFAARTEPQASAESAQPSMHGTDLKNRLLRRARSYQGIELDESRGGTGDLLAEAHCRIVKLEAKLAAGGRSVPQASAASEPVADTWLVGGRPDLMAMSGDVESDRVIKLHFRRPATDQDRKWLLEAINAKLAGNEPQTVSAEPVAFEFRQRSGCGKGPQGGLPWCDWCSIDRETYERYLREPNKLVQVRALYDHPARCQAGIEQRHMAQLLTILDVMKSAHRKEPDRLMSIWPRDIEAVEAAVAALTRPQCPTPSSPDVSAPAQGPRE